MFHHRQIIYPWESRSDGRLSIVPLFPISSVTCYVAPTKSGTTYCFSSVSLLLLYFPSFFLSFFQWILSKLVLRTALVDFIQIWHIAGPVPEVEPPTKFFNFGRAKFRLTRKNGFEFSTFSDRLEIWYLEYIRYHETSWPQWNLSVIEISGERNFV